MSNYVSRAVAALLSVQEDLSKMTVEDRMMVGEELGSSLRKAGVLREFSIHTSDYTQSCDIQAGAFGLSINASFGVELNDLDLPF